MPLVFRLDTRMGWTGKQGPLIGAKGRGGGLPIAGWVRVAIGCQQFRDKKGEKRKKMWVLYA